MKEQWKKLDSDAKLLVNVEEGRTLPIKIEFPVSTVASDRYGFCYRLHCVSLKTIFLLVLLGVLSWSAANLYTKYYPHSTFEPNKKVLIKNKPLYEPVLDKLEFINEVYESIPKENINDLRSNNVFINSDIVPKKLFDDASTTITAHEPVWEPIVYIPPVDKSTSETSAEDNSVLEINETKQSNIPNIDNLNHELQNDLSNSESSENYRADSLLFDEIFRDIIGFDSEKLKNVEKSDEDEDYYNLSRETKYANENEMIHLFNEIMSSIVTEKESSAENYENNEDIKNQEKSHSSEEKLEVIGGDISENIPNVSERYQMVSGPMSSFEHNSSEEKSQNSQENLQSLENISVVQGSDEVLSDNKENTSDSHQNDGNIEQAEPLNSEELKAIQDDSYESLNEDTTLKVTSSANTNQEKYVHILMAKQLEPILGKRHELLSWYYSNKDNPNFMNDNNKLKVFTAKMLFDTNIKDFNFDIYTIHNLISNDKYIQSLKKLTDPQEKISPETEDQVYIVDRLNTKNHMFDLYVRGLESAEAISSAIESLNEIELNTLNWLKELEEKQNDLSVNTDKISEETTDKEQNFLDVPNLVKDREDKILNVEDSSKSIDNSKNDSEESMPKNNAEFEEKTKSIIDAMKKVAFIDDDNQKEQSNSEMTVNESQEKSQESEDRLQENIQLIMNRLKYIHNPVGFISDGGDEFY